MVRQPRTQLASGNDNSSPVHPRGFKIVTRDVMIQNRNAGLGRRIEYTRDVVEKLRGKAAGVSVSFADAMRCLTV